MPELPHEYVVKDRTASSEDFERMAALIVANGYQRWFGRRRFTYWNVGGFKYWVMGRVLNRASLDAPDPTHAERP